MLMTVNWKNTSYQSDATLVFLDNPNPADQTKNKQNDTDCNQNTSRQKWQVFCVNNLAILGKLLEQPDTDEDETSSHDLPTNVIRDIKMSSAHEGISTN